MGEILFLAHRAPFPPDRGDKIRAFNVLKYLTARRNVHLVAFADDARDLDETLYPELTASRSLIWRGKSQTQAALEALATRQPVSLAAFADRRFAAAVQQILATRPIEAIYVFSSAIAQYVPLVPGVPFVMDFCDVDSAKFTDYAGRAGFPKAWMYRREASALLDFDRAIACRADASLFVSAAEAALFRSLGGEGNIHVVENGIDTDFFDPKQTFASVAKDGPLIVFTGQMDYLPNVQAARWFAEDILPIIHRRHSAARFAIVGRAPTAEVLALGQRDGVIVTGEVPDVRGWLAAADVVVAPLRIARGVQNKVLEAMAMARPVVASAAAAEGIEHAGTLRTGADADTMAAQVLDTLADPTAAAKLGERARAQVRARYGWEARLAPLDGLLRLGSGQSRSAA